MCVLAISDGLLAIQSDPKRKAQPRSVHNRSLRPHQCFGGRVRQNVGNFGYVGVGAKRHHWKNQSFLGRFVRSQSRVVLGGACFES